MRRRTTVSKPSERALPRRGSRPVRHHRGRPPPGRPGPPRLGLQGAARDHRGRPQARPAPVRGGDQQPRARHRHGCGRPRRADRVAALGRQRPAARRSRRPPGRRDLPRRALPQAPWRPGSLGGHGRADAVGRHRGPARAGQPPRRARPAGRRRDLDGGLERRRALRRRTPLGTVRHPPAQCVRRDAGPARRPLPQRRVRRAATAAGLGPGLRRADRPPRRPAAGRDQRRHHPRPRPVRRLPGRREGLPGRRARRGDGLRVARRRRVHPRHDQLAHRGHHPRPGARLPRARPARTAARSGPATPSAGPPSSARRSAPSPARSRR